MAPANPPPVAQLPPPATTQTDFAPHPTEYTGGGPLTTLSCVLGDPGQVLSVGGHPGPPPGLSSRPSCELPASPTSRKASGPFEDCSPGPTGQGSCGGSLASVDPTLLPLLWRAPGGEISPDPRCSGSERLPHAAPFQAGGLGRDRGNVAAGGLAHQGRHQGRLSPCPPGYEGPRIHGFPLRQQILSFQGAAVRGVDRSVSVHQDTPPSNRSSPGRRDARDRVSRRSLSGVFKPRSGYQGRPTSPRDSPILWVDSQRSEVHGWSSATVPGVSRDDCGHVADGIPLVRQEAPSSGIVSEGADAKAADRCADIGFSGGLPAKHAISCHPCNDDAALPSTGSALGDPPALPLLVSPPGDIISGSSGGTQVVEPRDARPHDVSDLPTTPTSYRLYGREWDRVGLFVDDEVSLRFLVNHGGRPFQQLERDDGSVALLGSSGLRRLGEGHTCPHGQHDNAVEYPPTGTVPQHQPRSGGPPDLAVGYGSRRASTSRARKRSRQRCRRRAQSHSAERLWCVTKMVCPSRPPLGSSPRRSIRLRHQRLTSRVREFGPRRKMPLLGRRLSPPASLWRVGPSSSGPDWSSPTADSPRPRARDDRGDTRLAFRVSTNPPAPRLRSTSPPPRRDSGPERPPPDQPQIRPDGLENFRTFWVNEGIPDAVIEVIVAGRRSSTWGSYRSSWRSYTAYCSTRDLRPLDPISLASFLVASYHEGKSYATIRSYAFGVSVCLPRPDGLPSLATTRVVADTLSGLKELAPVRVPCRTSWDVAHVLRFYADFPGQTALEVSERTALLVALATGWRPGSDLARISWSHCIVAPDGIHLVALRPKEGALKEVFLRRLPPPSACCPVAAVETYLLLTLSRRSDSTSLFITTAGPSRPATASTLGRWIASALHRAGITAPAHSTRAVGPSHALRVGIRIEAVLASANWRSASTFARFYQRTCRVQDVPVDLGILGHEPARDEAANAAESSQDIRF